MCVNVANEQMLKVNLVISPVSVKGEIAKKKHFLRKAARLPFRLKDGIV